MNDVDLLNEYRDNFNKFLDFIRGKAGKKESISVKVLPDNGESGPVRSIEQDTAKIAIVAADSPQRYVNNKILSDKLFYMLT